MKRKIGYSFCQITLINLLVLFTVLLMFAILAPMLQNTINTSADTMAGDPNPETSLIITLLQLSPAAIVIAIIITALNQSKPQVGSIQ